jgi:wyosine [tRNA(Phe)-imidazoG37] synthetase (radical SAM superfamily)
MTLLAMHERILYGPVNSRRYGRSLGINLMPAHDKLCSFNCVYCHFGLTRRCTTLVNKFAHELPVADDVIEAVEHAMKSPAEFNLITFSGNGEPTLHPEFPAIADAVVDLRNRLRPAVKVALLSNSTGLFRDEVRRVLSRFDLPILKLDAGSAKTFRAINRPARDVHFEEIVYLLENSGDIFLQTVLVDGTPSNVTPQELHSYFQLLAQIRPTEVHLYSIDRPVPDSDIRLVPPEKLREIAVQATTETGIKVKAFHAQH